MQTIKRRGTTQPNISSLQVKYPSNMHILRREQHDRFKVLAFSGRYAAERTRMFLFRIGIFHHKTNLGKSSRNLAESFAHTHHFGGEVSRKSMHSPRMRAAALMARRIVFPSGSTWPKERRKRRHQASQVFLLEVSDQRSAAVNGTMAWHILD